MFIPVWVFVALAIIGLSCIFGEELFDNFIGVFVSMLVLAVPASILVGAFFFLAGCGSATKDDGDPQPQATEAPLAGGTPVAVIPAMPTHQKAVGDPKATLLKKGLTRVDVMRILGNPDEIQVNGDQWDYTAERLCHLEMYGYCYVSFDQFTGGADSVGQVRKEYVDPLGWGPE